MKKNDESTKNQDEVKSLGKLYETLTGTDKGVRANAFKNHNDSDKTIIFT